MICGQLNSDNAKVIGTANLCLLVPLGAIAAVYPSRIGLQPSAARYDAVALRFALTISAITALKWPMAIKTFQSTIFIVAQLHDIRYGFGVTM